MAGTNFQFNIAKGEIKTRFTGIGTANAAIIVVPIEATGLETDATLKDYDNLSLLLAGTSNEQTTMGRKTLTTATVTIDDTNDWVTLTVPGSITWAAATGNAIAKLLFCHDNDTTTGTDTNILPLLAYSLDATPDGNDIVVTPHANGLIRLT